MQRIHPWKLKTAENSSWKAEKRKEFSLKGYKFQRNHTEKEKNAKKSPSKSEKWGKFTPKKTN